MQCFTIRAEDHEFTEPAHNAPDWVRNAVAYEIVIRAFNHADCGRPDKWKSPFGSAPYASVTEKLGYLQDLGITLIVLHTIYDHTPNTNLYANRHHRKAADLGTMADIKELVREAHGKNIRVISNTNCYGVAASSPMLRERPDWFLPAPTHICGQPVFDVANPDVVEYIVKTHVDWCRKTGLDGWRIDLANTRYRKAIWDRVLNACATKGQHLLLAAEARHLEGHIEGGGYPGSKAVPAGPRAIHDMQRLFRKHKTAANDPYRMREISSHNCKLKWPHNVDPEKFARQGCYQIQGSRFLFGHNYVFSPFVPWMFSGEEFAASHLAVPAMLPGIRAHGHKIPRRRAMAGKLLHAYLDWNDLRKNRDVFKDMRKILRIRHANSDLLHYNHHQTNLINVPCTSRPQSKVKPYARFLKHRKAIVVVGNESTAKDVSFTLNVPLEKMGMADAPSYRVTDLWNDRTAVLTKKRLAAYRLTVPKDQSPGGGVRALKIEPDA